MSDLVDHIFIAGAGAMGHGIAQVVMTAGLQVTLYDINDKVLTTADEKIKWSLDKLHEKQKITESPQTILARLHTTTDLQQAAAAEHVIEVVPEQLAIKQSLFEKLNTICSPRVTFSTNTSAIPISTLAAATGRADRFCGTHFFIPVPLMPLVEVIRGELTSDVTIDAATQLVERIGKQPVQVKRDIAGFLVNRILLAACVEAMELLQGGYASADDIDRAMQLGCNWHMGPLATCDLSGLDVMKHALEAIHAGTPHVKFNTPKVLATLVEQGKLGRKVGEGFYHHAKGASK